MVMINLFYTSNQFYFIDILENRFVLTSKHYKQICFSHVSLYVDREVCAYEDVMLISPDLWYDVIVNYLLLISNLYLLSCR